MLTRKYLRRKRRRIAAARFSPDEGEAVASGHALAVLAGHQWQDSGFDALGVPVPRRPLRPVGPLGVSR